MNYIQTEIDGVWLIEPKVFSDSRGYFMESFKKEEFGKYVSVLLTEDNKRQFFIPRGFAHGFLVLSEEVIFTYKVDNIYNPQAERSILYCDNALGIDWPIADFQIITSEKDRQAKIFQEAEYFV